MERLQHRASGLLCPKQKACQRCYHTQRPWDRTEGSSEKFGLKPEQKLLKQLHSAQDRVNKSNAPVATFSVTGTQTRSTWRQAGHLDVGNRKNTRSDSA